MKTVKVQLRVPEELHQRIVDWASKNHRSMNGQIVAVLDEYLRVENKPVTPQQPLKVDAA